MHHSRAHPVGFDSILICTGICLLLHSARAVCQGQLELAAAVVEGNGWKEGSQGKVDEPSIHSSSQPQLNHNQKGKFWPAPNSTTIGAS